jgi:hypothetical protein
MFIGSFFPAVRLPQREADHSHPFSPEVTNSWSFTSGPLYVLFVLKYRGNISYNDDDDDYYYYYYYDKLRAARLFLRS